MKISFVLPGSARVPVGGYKCVFAVANRLAERGWSVTLIFPALTASPPTRAAAMQRWFRYHLGVLTRFYEPDRWIRLDPRVRLRWVPSLSECSVPDADVVVATGWPTAEPVAEYGRTKGRKFYFIQHFETWWGGEVRVRRTWHLPLRKIVIARWLQDVAVEMGEEASYVPNGLDFREFGVDLPIDRRDPSRVLMLYHESDWKGSADGLEALKRARARVPALRATLFGVWRKPEGLPDWIEYVRNPARARLRALYNQAAIFLAPSWVEGWPLPPAEAMASGCALVATDIGGHREYAEHDVTALLAPARDPDALANSLRVLLTDDAYRQRIAVAGLQTIRRFTLDLAVSRLEELFSKP